MKRQEKSAKKKKKKNYKYEDTAVQTVPYEIYVG